MRNPGLAKAMLTLLMVALTGVVLLVACAQPAPSPAPAPKPSPSPSPSPSPKPTPTPTPTAKAPSAADFYKDKTITFLVNMQAGGGTDTAARILSAAWPAATGINVKIENEPAGGGMAAVNQLNKIAPDGLTLGVAAFGSYFGGPPAFKDPNMQYDVTKLNWIGLYGDEVYVSGVGKHIQAQSMADLQKIKGIKLGVTGKTVGPAIGSALVLELFGLQEAQVVSGYSGTPDVALAVARKEVDGMSFPGGSYKPEVDKGWLQPPLVAINTRRSAMYPDTKAIPEVLKLTPEQTKLLDMFMLLYLPARSLYAPPGVPEDRLKFLRDSFNKVMVLPAFKEAGAKRWGSIEPPLGPDEIKPLIAKVLAFSKEDIDKFNGMRKYIK